jgi:anthranilate synthase/phosphoribosyltransferase
MILILDNYDSFTYNLYQIFLKLNYPIKVIRSDKTTVEEIEKINPNYIILSPGPGTPQEAGICIEVVQKLKGKYPILGVCLGHQAILASFGVPIVNAARIVHGKVEKLVHNGKGILRNISPDARVTRYHSLAAKEIDIPECFEVTAKCEDGEVMAVEHKNYHLVGVQFHPESIGTKEGEKMILNFLNYRRDSVPVKEYLGKLLTKSNLTFRESYDIMDELTDGNMHDSQIGSLLTALQMKGLTSEELAGFASVMRKKAISFPKPKDGEIRLDTCGTGGSLAAKTFNVSSVCAILANTCGIKVVKHGNRAATSRSGSADVLEKLGVNIDMSVSNCINTYRELGLTFLFARKFHGAMKFAAPTRHHLGFKTAFNYIGPLSNPAYATHQIIGISDRDFTEKFCESLSMLGVKRALVVSGFDGLDEISLSAPTKISELKDGWIRSYVFNPESIGLKFIRHSDLVGGDVEKNSAIALEILSGEDSTRSDLVYLNTGAALYLCGITDSIGDGYKKARDVAKTGNAMKTLEKFVALSNKPEENLT